MAYPGFPRKVRFTPVPNPLFGTLLEQIDDLDELRLTLRVIWLLHQKKGYPRFLSRKDLLADRVLTKALADETGDPRPAIDRAMTKGVARGTLATVTALVDGVQERVYVLNTEADRKALSLVASDDARDVSPSESAPWEGVVERPNIFSMYEDNVGMLSPMIAEELREAEAAYPQSWIEEAFRRAVSGNKRSWRYISAILERWEREGKDDGGAVRSPERADYY